MNQQVLGCLGGMGTAVMGGSGPAAGCVLDMPRAGAAGGYSIATVADTADKIGILWLDRALTEYNIGGIYPYTVRSTLLYISLRGNSSTAIRYVG